MNSATLHPSSLGQAGQGTNPAPTLPGRAQCNSAVSTGVVENTTAPVPSLWSRPGLKVTLKVSCGKSGTSHYDLTGSCDADGGFEDNWSAAMKTSRTSDRES